MLYLSAQRMASALSPNMVTPIISSTCKSKSSPTDSSTISDQLSSPIVFSTNLFRIRNCKAPLPFFFVRLGHNVSGVLYKAMILFSNLLKGLPVSFSFFGSKISNCLQLKTKYLLRSIPICPKKTSRSLDGLFSWL